MKLRTDVRLERFVKLGTDVRTDVGADVGADVGSGNVGTNVEGRGTVVFVEVKAHFPKVTPK